MKKVSISSLLFFIVFLCYKCFVKNDHDKKHSIIDIDDIGSLEESGISFEKTVPEFDKIFNKTKNIKDRIEEEIEEINNLHKKLMDEITASFEEKHIKLNHIENELKSDLDTKVTQIKNQLENFLLESHDILTSCERANKYYEMNKDSNEIKTLFYISQINKFNEKAKELFQKPIKNLDIYFNSDLNKIDYKDYYFSGIPIPKNIKAKEKRNEVYISWDIHDFRIKNFDINNIKYKIEIKGNNKTSIYESLETKLILEDYEVNKEYEIKIRAEIDNYFGKWSQVETFIIEDKNIEIKLNPFYHNNQGGGLFGNINQGGGLFGSNDQVRDLFGNNNMGGGLFGNINQGGGLFGSNDQVRDLFGNNNMGGGLFGNNNKGGNLFGNNNMGGGLFGNNNKGENLFGNNNKGEKLFGNNNKGEKLFGNNNKGEKLFGNNNKGEKLFGNNNQ